MDSRPLGTIDYGTLKQQICDATAFELEELARILKKNPTDRHLECFIEILDKFKTSLKTALLFWKLGESERQLKQGKPDADRVVQNISRIIAAAFGTGTQAPPNNTTEEPDASDGTPSPPLTP